MTGTSPPDLVAAARAILRGGLEGAQGCWPRAVAVLTRQALEQALDAYWSQRRPGVEGCPSMRAKMLCLPTYSDETTARQAFDAWAALSSACHVRGYDLDPTAAELESMIESVEAVLGRLGPAGG